MQTTSGTRHYQAVRHGHGGPGSYSTYLFSLYIYDTAFKYFDIGYGAALAWILFLVVAVFAGIAFKSSKYWNCSTHMIKEAKMAVFNTPFCGVLVEVALCPS